MVSDWMVSIDATEKIRAQKAWQDWVTGKTEDEPAQTTLTRQVGGDHYKKQGASMQPWAIIDAWGLDFYAGNVLKYILRYKYKDGVEDLKKARHYLDRMIEKAEDQTVFDALKKRNAGKYDENPS